MPAIRFRATLSRSDPTAKDDPGALVTLPLEASEKLASRSTTLVEGVINGLRFRAALEPDGQGSHWFTVGQTVRKAAGVNVGDAVTLEVNAVPVKEWPEPKVPTDVQRTLKADPKVYTLWTSLTPMARWDWVRWTDTVKLIETRRERPEKLRSMLKAGKRRPCCFNRAARTPPKDAELL